MNSRICIFIKRVCMDNTNNKTGLFLKRKLLIKPYSGSFTVEASFVMPLIIICMVVIVWISFYLFNRIKATADADGLIFKLERELAMSDDDPGRMEKDVMDEIDGYFAAIPEKALLIKDGRNISVSICLRMKEPSVGLLGRLLSDVGLIQIERNATLMSRAETGRIIRAAEDTVKQIKEQIKGGS